MTQQTVAILEDLITGLKGTLHQYQDKKAGYMYPVGYSDEIEIGLGVLIQRVHLLWQEAKRNYHTDIVSLTNSHSIGTCNPPRGIVYPYREALDYKPTPREEELSREIELLRQISRDRENSIYKLNKENTDLRTLLSVKQKDVELLRGVGDDQEKNIRHIRKEVTDLRAELDQKHRELVSLQLERSAERQTKPGAVDPSMSNVRKQQYENGQPAEDKQSQYDKLVYVFIDDLIALLAQPARQSIARQKITISQSLQHLLNFALTQGKRS